ncbi:hypothetical protein COBT_003097 [Conglomerata obtusa]
MSLYLLVFIICSIISTKLETRIDKINTEALRIINEVHPGKKQIFRNMHYFTYLASANLLCKINKILKICIQESNYTPFFATQCFDDSLHGTEIFDPLDVTKLKIELLSFCNSLLIEILVSARPDKICEKTKLFFKPLKYKFLQNKNKDEFLNNVYDHLLASFTRLKFSFKNLYNITNLVSLEIFLCYLDTIKLFENDITLSKLQHEQHYIKIRQIIRKENRFNALDLCIEAYFTNNFKFYDIDAYSNENKNYNKMLIVLEQEDYASTS